MKRFMIHSHFPDKRLRGCFRRGLFPHLFRGDCHPPLVELWRPAAVARKIAGFFGDCRGWPRRPIRRAFLALAGPLSVPERLARNHFLIKMFSCTSAGMTVTLSQPPGRPNVHFEKLN